MKHSCAESTYTESGVSYHEKSKLWWFELDQYNHSGPISFCPYCGVKLPYNSIDLENYKENLRKAEEDAKRKHEELMRRIKENPGPDPYDDDIPEHNPLKSPR